jgi:hypothetical protein
MARNRVLANDLAAGRAAGGDHRVDWRAPQDATEAARGNAVQDDGLGS